MMPPNPAICGLARECSADTKTAIRLMKMALLACLTLIINGLCRPCDTQLWIPKYLSPATFVTAGDLFNSARLTPSATLPDIPDASTGTQSPSCSSHRNRFRRNISLRPPACNYKRGARIFLSRSSIFSLRGLVPSASHPLHSSRCSILLRQAAIVSNIAHLSLSSHPDNWGWCLENSGPGVISRLHPL